MKTKKVKHEKHPDTHCLDSYAGKPCPKYDKTREVSHTPTPWNLKIEYSDISSRHIYEVTSGANLLFSDEEYYPKAPELKDAEFIVRAVNSHKALLKALKKALLGLDLLESADGDLGNSLRDAITQAEGDEELPEEEKETRRLQQDLSADRPTFK